jgi:hypothetical protein
MRLRLVFMNLFVVLLLALTWHSQAADVAVPDELKSWQGWVLHGEEYRRCPFFASHLPSGSNDYVCAWPERLTLDLNARGGDFTQRWQIFSDSWIALPGDTQHWPRNVRLNGVAAPVIEREGLPKLRLTPGSYTVTGAMQWSARPEQLAIPAQTGIVELTVDGRVIAQPERPGFAVWLGKRRSAEQPQQTSMQVYRLVKDDVPAMLTTQIRLQISGEAREDLLGQALPEGFIPLSIASTLPARIESDGNLRVQLRPGQWNITIEARGASIATDLSAPIVGDTGEEIWSYQSNDRLRIAAVEGVETIDPAQANVPGEWHGLPTYRMSKGAVLKVVERSRGLENQDANQLHLSRQLWLDFAHNGYTAIDRITGSMHQEWRLDMAKPFVAMSVLSAADNNNLLVTAGAAPELTGVELRTPNLNLQTVSRLTQSSGRMPATGWQTRFASVTGQLNLPPGHHLISTFGEVDAPTSWTASWGLLDCFVVLIVAVGAWKLRSISFGVLALAALLLVHQEHRLFAWLLVNVLIAVALVNVTPDGLLKTMLSWYRAISFAVIVLAFLPFAFAQIRLGLYPQLESTTLHSMIQTVDSTAVVAPEIELPAVKMEMPMPAAAMPKVDMQANELDKSSNYPRRKTFSKSSQKANVSQRYAPGTVVQTGPGKPSWNYNSYPYSWSGPVVADETVRFIIATPFWMFVWRMTGVLLLAGIIVGVARMSFKFTSVATFIHPYKNASSGAAMFVFAALSLLAMLPVNSYAAATPDPQILADLKARLTQPPVCTPNCSETVAAQISVTADKLDMSLEMTALANVAVAIPVAVGRWEPESITVDGQSAGAIYRDTQQNFWVMLKSGAHTIRLSGRLASAESIQLLFPQRPRAIVTSGSGWEFSGVNDGRLLTNAIELVRQRSSASSDKLSSAAQFAPFVRVRRLVQFGLDWSVVTIVERVAPDKGAFTIEIPLLKDESVLTPGVTLRESNGVHTVLVGLSAGENEATWTSALPRADSMELAVNASSARALDRTESWSFAVSPVWNVQFVGVPQVTPLDPNALWTFDYFPRVGEKLKLVVYRPEAVAGQTLAIDNVQLVADVGKRATNNALQLSYRSTQGGRHSIVLPKDSQVTSVTVDGAPVPVRPQNGELPISLLPGEHQLAVQWQTDMGAQWRTDTSPVNLKASASNVTMRVNLGSERWVLFARGQGVGPAILYWGELLVFIVLAVLLGRYTVSPLRMHDWLLLGLGLSTYSWSVLLFFAVWIFAMRWRSTPRDLSPAQFNLQQLALGALTIFAIGSLVSAIPNGLLRQPDMSVRSPGGGFSWFVDQATSTLPQPSVYSVPLFIYKIAILLWALWLSFALIRWLPWAWTAFTTNGLWRAGTAKHKKFIATDNQSSAT